MKWTPSKMIARLGKEINNPESVYYWAQKVRGWVGPGCQALVCICLFHLHRPLESPFLISTLRCGIRHRA